MNCAFNHIIKIKPLKISHCSLYNSGFNPKIKKMYPTVEYPVTRGTSMISPLIEWNHDEDWFIYKYTKEPRSNLEHIVRVCSAEEEWKFIEGHNIDGNVLFPASGYIQILVSCFDEESSDFSSRNSIIIFQNINVRRSTIMRTSETIKFNVSIMKKSGSFEICEADEIVCSGGISVLEKNEMHTNKTETQITSMKNLEMKHEDIYKVLRLRGYKYSGNFRSIEECDLQISRALIKWNGNWITFIDGMLQLKILEMESEQLFVIMDIAKICIDVEKHMSLVETSGRECLLPVHNSGRVGEISCGGITIEGVILAPILRKTIAREPLLEKYEFVPNWTTTTFDNSLRIIVQIIAENLQTTKLAAVELIDDAIEEEHGYAAEVLSKLSCEVLIPIETTVLSSSRVPHLKDIKVENKSLSTVKNCCLVIASKLFQRSEVLLEAAGVLLEGGFILSREDAGLDEAIMNFPQFTVLTVHKTECETLVLIRKIQPILDYSIIEISNEDEEFNWLSNVQNTLCNDENLIIFATDQKLNGIQGFYNSLKKEAGSSVRCFSMSRNEPDFDINHPFYKNQLKKTFAVNVYKDGSWGTYRFLPLTKQNTQKERIYCTASNKGDLLRFEWKEGDFQSSDCFMLKEEVQVYYASLNFRDILFATGYIKECGDEKKLEHSLGLEFVGRDSRGRRVMGILGNGALSTVVAADRLFVWNIPNNWTMEEAATVPMVYITALYALIEKAKLKEGETVLIHNGAGGVGQAAINIALAYGANVFTTVGSPEKIEYLQEIFPHLNDSHIGNSRDISFRKMIMKGTRGRGVDVVLNTLSGEKQLESIKSLSEGGRFLEIGKTDLLKNQQLQLMLLRKSCSFHGISLDKCFESSSVIKKSLRDLLTEGIKEGVVRPIDKSTFTKDEVGAAFRLMASGNNKGKVVIKMRDEENINQCQPENKLFKCSPRYFCDPSKTYIILGGLGGVGMELANWLVIRGARKILLSSRKGEQSGYFRFKNRKWKSLGVQVKISTADITCEEGCNDIISAANSLGPVCGIFNLAVVLFDSLLENQTRSTFIDSFGPKVKATMFIDQISRIRCPELRSFVVFSSFISGRGNMGQTSYGMSNSTAEKICEERKRNGYPALAIQWGTIADVGLVAENPGKNVNTSKSLGIIDQPISSCLEVLDKLMCQTFSPIVSSTIIADKTSIEEDSISIIDEVLDILGIKKKNISMDARLTEYGMDSIMTVEIKQLLEKNHSIFLTSKAIRGLTLLEIQNLKSTKNRSMPIMITENMTENEVGVNEVIRLLGDEESMNVSMMRLPSLVTEDPGATTVFLFPGTDGVISYFKPMAARIEANVYSLQYNCALIHHTKEDIVQFAVEEIQRLVRSTEPLHIIAYSWGVFIGSETMASLESKGFRGTFTCIDSSPDFITKMTQQRLRGQSCAEMEANIICYMLEMHIPPSVITENKVEIINCVDYQERISKMIEISEGTLPYSEPYLRQFMIGLRNRFYLSLEYKKSFKNIESPTYLFKPTIKLIDMDIGDDYNLTSICPNFVESETIEGNHSTMLKNVEMVKYINRIISRTSSEHKFN